MDVNEGEQASQTAIVPAGLNKDYLYIHNGHLLACMAISMEADCRCPIAPTIGYSLIFPNGVGCSRAIVGTTHIPHLQGPIGDSKSALRGAKPISYNVIHPQLLLIYVAQTTSFPGTRSSKQGAALIAIVSLELTPTKDREKFVFASFLL